MDVQPSAAIPVAAGSEQIRSDERGSRLRRPCSVPSGLLMLASDEGPKRRERRY